MKSLHRSIILMLSLLFQLSVNAQFNDGFHFERLDSTYEYGNILNVLETSQYYFIVNNKSVYKVTKQNFFSENIYSSNENNISCSFKDSLGNIAIVEGKNLKLYQAGIWQNIHIPCGFSYPNKAMVDLNNNIYLGNNTDSLYIYNNNIWSKKKIMHGGTYALSYKMLAGPNHEFRFYTKFSNPMVVYELQGQLAVELVQIDTYASEAFYDTSERIWFQKGGNLCRLSNQNIIDTVLIPSEVVSNFNIFFINSSGTKIWLTKSSLNDSINFFDGNSWHKLFHDHISNNNYYCEYWQLSDDVIVDYTNDSGVLQNLVVYENNLPNEEIPIYNLLTNSKFNDMVLKMVYNPFFYSHVDLLLATDGGLIRRTVEDINIYQQWDSVNSNLPSSRILSIATTNEEQISDTLYIGTDKGFVIAGFEEDSLVIYRIYTTQNSTLPTDTISCIKYFAPNEIWLGTNNKGLIKYEPGNGFTYYNVTNSILGSNQINNIYKVPYSNDFYVATANGFAKIQNNAIVEQFNTSNSGMIENNISFVRKIGNKTFVGSFGSGLAQFSDINQWTYYNTANSNFSSDSIYYIASQNTLWDEVYLIGTNRGIVRVEFDGFDEPIFIEQPINGINESFKNIKFGESYFPCGSIGSRFVSLSESGIASSFTCLSGLQSFTQNSDLRYHLSDNKLSINSKLKGTYQIEIYSIEGKRLFYDSIDLNQSNSKSIPSLNSGIYLVRLSNTNQSFSSKVIYNK